MGDRAAVARILRQAVEEVGADRTRLVEIGEDTTLGDAGIGLDSIEIVEVLLACEEATGIPVGALLEDEGELRFGAVVDHFAGG